ncbi:ANTAR domain-containing protein [Streptomyces sp. NPDC057620]|uniref:ANTAR domain-containing protein n=1 Tax=Streptomyces sp. NPDC057620 TaxID=3346185 RepID=UPI0036B296A1
MLLQEIAQMHTALKRRPVIDMARGVLMALWSCSADDAWEVLANVSQQSNTKRYDISEGVLATVRGEPMPLPLQPHLATASDRLHAH